MNLYFLETFARQRQDDLLREAGTIHAARIAKGGHSGLKSLLLFRAGELMIRTGSWLKNRYAIHEEEMLLRH